MDQSYEDKSLIAADYIIKNCLSISVGEKILIIYDESTKKIIRYFYSLLVNYLGKDNVALEKINLANKHGEEPSEALCNNMLKANKIICLTKYSLAHTKARRLANLAKIGFLSMPDYNLDILNSKAIKADYRIILPKVEKMTNLLTNAINIQIKSEKGTNINLDVKERRGNCCPGFIDDYYLLGSPPDIEANIAPVECASNGIIKVDGSITHERLGLLNSHMDLVISDGKIVDIKSENINDVVILKEILSECKNDDSYILAELGVGFNPEAELCGNMLIDEGTLGNIHFGFGSNWTIGGMNNVDFHLDFVVIEPSLYIDGNLIMESGVIL